MTCRVDGSLLPPCEAQWLNSVPQMWQVSSHHPVCVCVCVLNVGMFKISTGPVKC